MNATPASLFDFPAPGDRVTAPSGLTGLVTSRACRVAVVRHDNGQVRDYRPEALTEAGPLTTVMTPVDASISTRVRDGLVPLRDRFKAMLLRRMDADGTDAISVPVMNGSARSGEVTYTRAELS